MSKTEHGVTAMGVLALELTGASAPERGALAPEQAGMLAEHIGCDLAQWIPEIRDLELSVALAHFDPAEVLRPGWPLHRRLEELQARAPGRDQEPRVLAFGADAQGEIPLPFQADAQLVGGGLRVLPFLLSGDPQTVATVADAMEEVLLAQGMAQADTALLAQESFGARIEHARYLTANDLAAMMSMQYDNQGLAPLWPLIEAALLAPHTEEWLEQAPEPVLRYIDGEVRIALFGPAAGAITTRTTARIASACVASTSNSSRVSGRWPPCWKRMACRCCTCMSSLARIHGRPCPASAS